MALLYSEASYSSRKGAKQFRGGLPKRPQNKIPQKLKIINFIVAVNPSPFPQVQLKACLKIMLLLEFAILVFFKCKNQ